VVGFVDDEVVGGGAGAGAGGAGVLLGAGGINLPGVTVVLWPSESRRLTIPEKIPPLLMSMFGGAAIADANMVNNTDNKRTMREAITSELLRKKNDRG